MGQATGAPEVDPPAQSYQEEVDRLKQFIRLRLTWLDVNMPGTMNGCNLTSVETVNSTAPNATAFPNPFTGQLTVQLQLAQPEQIQLSLTDMAGRNVLSMPVQQLAAGSQQLQLDTRNLPAGVYLLRIESGDTARTLRVVKAE
jgi:hypothetical protein